MTIIAFPGHAGRLLPLARIGRDGRSMTDFVQNLVDGLGRGSLYALLGLGIAVIFGVMHLLNFAHGELITVSGYVTYWCFQAGLSWWLIAPIIVVTSILTSITIEQVAFRWVRGAPDFTLLLTSFGVHFVVEAFFLMYVSASVKTYNRPGWITNTVDIGSITIEVFDLVVIAVTLGGPRPDRSAAAAHDVRDHAARRGRGLRRRPADGRQVEPGDPWRVRPLGSAGRDRRHLLADARRRRSPRPPA